MIDLMPAPCSRDDCSEPSVAKGLCNRHYHEEKRRARGSSDRIGRPQKYEGSGAPTITIRVEPDVLGYVTARPEGVRAWLDRVAREDMAREADAPNARGDDA